MLARDNREPENLPPAADAESNTTGLPLLRTWRAVYAVVLVSFALWVGLMFALERIFS